MNSSFYYYYLKDGLRPDEFRLDLNMNSSFYYYYLKDGLRPDEFRLDLNMNIVSLAFLSMNGEALKRFCSHDRGANLKGTTKHYDCSVVFKIP